MRRTFSPVRGIAALVVLLIVVITVFSWWGDFRAATRAEEVQTKTQDSSEDTGTPSGDGDATEPTSTGDAPAPATPKTITVLVDGLNLRVQPSDDSDRIRSLEAGTKLTYVATEGSWYKVKDPDGKVGYISSNTQYSRAE